MRGGEWARARGRRRQKLLPLLPFARLIRPLAQGARRILYRLPPHSSLEPSRQGLATPGPHSVPICDCRRVPSGAQKKNLRSPRTDPGTSRPSALAGVCHGSRSEPGCCQVQTASRLLTALPARRPLKRKREGETARVKKESALPGRAAGAIHRGRGAGRGSFALSGSRAILRLRGTTPAPPRSPRTRR